MLANPVVDPLIRLPPQRNAFLAALSDGERRAVAACLEHVRLPAGRALDEPGWRQDHIYFPTTGVVSVHYADSNGAITELAQVGREGVVGLSALLGEQPMMLRAVVQIPGEAYRMPAAAARASFAAGGPFQQITLRYALAFMLQLAHTAVCNMRHSVAQQFCRWLLLCHDRVEAGEIRMTHEVIAGILGVRRQSVTEAAKKLEKRNIIAYHRGCIRILDRRALELCACDCYELVRRQTESILSGHERRAPPFVRARTKEDPLTLP